MHSYFAAMTKQLQNKLIQVAAGVGIDARNKTVAEVKTEYAAQGVKKFVDQYDMAFVNLIAAL